MEVNTLLRELADEVVEEQVEIIYSEYIDELCANEEMMCYASYSYDRDAQYYGEM